MRNINRQRAMPFIVGVSALVFAIFTINSANAVEFIEETKLMASDGITNGWFGSSVAVDGNTAVIGANQDDDLGIDSGSAYVFIWDGTSWVEQQKLTASDGAAGDNFGSEVAMNGDFIIIGSYRDDDSTGSAYVFMWDGTSWIEQQKLTASDRDVGDYFGASIEVDGNIIIIGAWRDDDLGSSSGSAYVFMWDGTTWVEQPKLTASDGIARDYFGSSVAVDSDIIVIGAGGDDDHGSGSGSAYVFTWNGIAWIEEQKLTASDGAEWDSFGWLGKVEGDIIVVGADTDDDLGLNSGSAYVFMWDGTTWVEQHKLTASDGAAFDQFGFSLALDGDTVVIGARQDDDLGVDSGSVYVFRRDGTSWVEQSKLTASDGASGDRFGYSVALESNTVVVGAYLDDDMGIDSGSAYVFSLLSNETPAGEDVFVRPSPVDEFGDPIVDAPAISLSFDSVIAAGETFVTITENGPPPPGGFELIGLDGGTTYFEIVTTATFEGFVKVCINYSGFTLAVDPSELSLAHIVDGEWIGLPVTNDLVNKVLCGETPSFSLFALVHVPDPFVLLSELYSAVDGLDATEEVKESLTSKLAKIERLMGDGDAARAASDLVWKFIPKVQKYSGKHISIPEADDLIRSASELVNVILF